MADRAAAAPFPTQAQASSAERLGMLIFLASEIMLFGGLFTGALAMRIDNPAGYAKASSQLHWGLGGINTAILLTSSLFVAIAVTAVQFRKPRLSAGMLAASIALGLAFLGVKLFEYASEYRDGLVPTLNPAHLNTPYQALFMNLYFSATGLHAMHVIVGLGLLGSLIWPFGRARTGPPSTFVGNAGLYWHLVDIVWLFLYPTLYLAR